MNPARNFRGYGGEPPAPGWPGGARVAVSIVGNVEEGAELSRSDGGERNEAGYEVQDEGVGAPDPGLGRHFEYGPAPGHRRILDALGAADAPATFSACGRAIERSPWMASEAAARGHEVSCHGWRWERHAGMAEPDERAAIARTVAVIAKATGAAPVGWH